MYRSRSIATTLATALLALAAYAAGAGAMTMSVSPAGAENATSSSVTFEGGGMSIICPLTLRYSLLTGPITVARGAQIGEATALTIGSCSGGEIEMALGMPWHKTINDTLPTVLSLTTRNLTGILFNVEYSFVIRRFGGILECLYAGRFGQLMPVTHTARESTTYTANTLRYLSNLTITFVRGSIFCPTTIDASGSLSMATQTITLA